MAAEATRRIFFALWPEAAVARQLHVLGGAAHAICGGRRMRLDTLHMTLAFLGDVAAAQFDAACAAADEVAQKLGAGDTPMPIDRLAHWKHNHIVWAGCDEAPAAVATLAATLAAGLRQRGFQLDSRPFAAHVTLLRNARCSGELPPITVFEWPVRDFVLVQSHLDPAGAQYEIVRRWAAPSRQEPP
jgi:RNA 2',3'-cyclic 3'-phosphodiesterase